MLTVVTDFLSITGVNAVVPSTLGELIPYMLNVTVGVVLVSGVFKAIGAGFKGLMGWLASRKG